MAPITSITSQDIQKTGLTSAEDILNQLPQVFSSQGSSVSNGATGISTVDLRHLGPNRTMVLVNGRRLMPGDPGADTDTGSAADLNFIPMLLVKRVDVLTGGASATYGADAVAGVVNFVLDTDFEGIKVDFQDGIYQHNNNNKYMQGLQNDEQAAGNTGYDYPKGSRWDGNGFTGTIAAGTKFGDGRGHITGYVSYRRQNAISQGKRDYSSCTLDDTGSACGGSATSNPPNGLYYPSGGTSSTIGAFGNGTITRGGQNLYNYGPTSYYQRNDSRWNAGFFADYDVSEAFHPYAEFMFMSDHTKAQIAPSGDFGNTTTINCDNPYLSAAQASEICNASNMVTGYNATGFPIAAAGDQSQIATYDTTGNTAYLQTLWRNTLGTPRIDDLRHQSYRGLLGAKGELSPNWSYDGYLQYSRTAYKETYYGDVSTSRLANALHAVTNGSNVVCASGSADGCAPLNIFTGTPSQEALDYISGIGRKTGYTSELIANGVLNGNLTDYGVKTPWADTGANIAIGAQFRREGLALHPNDAYITGDLTGQGGATLPVQGSYTVIEGFFEGQMPIIEDKLNLNAGYRFSHYRLSTGRTYNTNTYKIGVDFTPVEGLRFRGGFNRAARAPNLQELFNVQHVALDGSTDPCTDIDDTNAAGCAAQGVPGGVLANPAGQYNGFIGGNPDLKPETAYTKTLGVVFQPQSVHGLSLSVDFYDVKIKNAIEQFGADAILGACSSGSTIACDLVNRAGNGSLWTSSDGYVIDLPQNIPWLKSQGFDISARYSHDVGSLGRLTADIDGTITTKYATDNGISASYNCAGYYGTTCGVPTPKWRHRARLTLDTPMHDVSVSVAWRFIGPVKADYRNSSATLKQDVSGIGDRIGSYSYFDLSLTGSVNDFIKLRAGVNNIFDKEPPLVGTDSCDATYCNGNTYPGAYDAMGRYLFVGATLQFK